MSHQLFYPKQRITSDETTPRLTHFRGLRSRRFVSAEEFARAEGVGLPDERSEELCEAKSQEAEPLSCPARR